MSAALTLAIYILTCREMGEVPVFPGNKFFYNSVDDASYAPSLADMNVWAATSDNTKNEAFNHTNGDVIVWKHFWPKLGKYFGIDVSPSPNYFHVPS
jgi:nucleoside-diphosphate-sugar epimerase